VTRNLQVSSDDDVVLASQMSREHARLLGGGKHLCHLLDLVVRELAWNLVRHAGGGRLLIQNLEGAVVIESQDEGPGIAATCGQGEGLGLGLRTVQSLANEFTLSTEPGHGTRIRAVLRWP